MLTETFQTIGSATRNVFANWRSVIITAVVYATLLAALYVFIVVREASLFQVGITFALAVVAPLLFFLLQALIAGETDQAPLGRLLKNAFADFWKLLLVTLPLIALGILILYLLHKAQTRFGTPPPDTLDVPRRVAGRAKENPIEWRTALVSMLRYLLLGLVLPLTAIHIWLATARQGLGPALRRLLTLLRQALAPQSVLIYIAGFVVFGVVPYFLLFRTTQVNRAWLEVFVFGVRLAVVFALTLLGWMITVRALGISSRISSSSPNEA